MSTKLKDYQAGREDGLALALQIVREGGLEALEKEIRARGITGIHTSLCSKDLADRVEPIKNVMFETVTIAFLASLHDEYGFGQKRCQKVMDRFCKLTAYLDNGWLYWADLIQSLKEDVGIELIDDYLKRADMSGKYAHPTSEDCYTETEWVNPTAWQEILKELNFTEEEPSEDGWIWILDENGQRFIRYHGKFDQISAYDSLLGIILAKDHWGIK